MEGAAPVWLVFLLFFSKQKATLILLQCALHTYYVPRGWHQGLG